MVNYDLVIDVGDHVHIRCSATRKSRPQIFGRDPEETESAVANPEVQDDWIEQERGDGPAAGIVFVGSVTLRVGGAEPVGGAGSIEGRDAGASDRQRDAAGEVTSCHVPEGRARAERDQETGLFVPPSVGRYFAVVAEEDPCLGKRGCGGDSAAVRQGLVAIAFDQLRHEWHMTLLERGLQPRVAETVDVDHHQAFAGRCSRGHRV